MGRPAGSGQVESRERPSGERLDTHRADRSVESP